MKQLGIIEYLASTDISNVQSSLVPPRLRTQIVEYMSELGNKSLTSFSSVKWKQFAKDYGAEFGLSMDHHDWEMRLGGRTTPSYPLPPTFLKHLIAHALCWIDVYGRISANEVRLRLLEPFLVPIIALFQGRVIDQPEELMEGRKHSTGGRVEHEIILVGGVLFFVVELKADIKRGKDPIYADHVAQLFLELLSAAEHNRSLDLDGLQIHGLLSDFSMFFFYTYDPTTKCFYRNERIAIAPYPRTQMCQDLVQVCNKIFGVILTAYIEGLEALAKKSRKRAARGNFSNESSSPFMTNDNNSGSDPQDSGTRKSRDMAIHFAKLCQQTLGTGIGDIGEIEQNGAKALAYLKKSVSSIKRESDEGNLYKTELDIMTEKDRFDLADKSVCTQYELIRQMQEHRKSFDRSMKDYESGPSNAHKRGRQEFESSK
ncbi:hypothetical protein CPB84DRAFT_1844803 [Gymnopilus junonius]|uniref:Uncharacterized protein n=1 Tax=Gymnopilus junonius TaxID=109634 RepID=A0A9P5NT80_GYMJU|nr:hypothetical protein CPB84DRAFT_1844803 [Gymnopilus junonius]